MRRQQYSVRGLLAARLPPMGRTWQSRVRVYGVVATLALPTLLGCERSPNALARIKHDGVLRVAVRPAPKGAHHSPVHLERELAQRFARWLGVETRFVVHRTPAHAFGTVAVGSADFAAVGDHLPRHFTPALLTGPTLRHVEHVVVYRRKSRRPRSVADLAKRPLVVAEGTALPDAIAMLDAVPVNVERSADTPTVLASVWRKRASLTVTTTEYLASMQLRYPELAQAFTLGKRTPVAWVFRRGDDDSLRRAAIHFLNEMRRSGELARIRHRHTAHLERFDYVDTRRFIRAMRKRLPAYREVFEASAQANGLDWRWLAAIGYHESHWDPDAVSPTGVRGLMMLTKPTAKGLGVDRTDPHQSIEGAARYVASLQQQLPHSVPPLERPWFALAAYHLGPRHLDGIRALTARAGGDPNRWADAERQLPRLRQSAWYSTLPSGRARGHETVRYVHNVRRYYDILRWHLPEKSPAK